MAHYFRLKCLNTDKTLRKCDTNEKKRRKSVDVEELPQKRNKPATPTSVVKVDGGAFQKIFIKSVYNTDRALEKKMAEIHDEQVASTSNVDDSENDSLDAVLATLEGKEQFIIEKREDEPNGGDSKKTAKKKGKWNLTKPRDSGIFSTSVHDESESDVLRSDIGEFPAEIIESVYNNTFCLADGFLFEFGLIKQGQR